MRREMKGERVREKRDERREGKRRECERREGKREERLQNDAALWLHKQTVKIDVLDARVSKLQYQR